MEYNLQLLRAVAENVLYKTYNDAWLAKYVEIKNTIDDGNMVFNLTHLLNPGAIFDPVEYNDRMTRLNVELAYMYQASFEQESDINDMVNRLDTSIDKSLQSYKNVLVQSNILRQYIETSKDYLEIYDSMDFIPGSEIEFNYGYDSLYFPSISVSTIGSYITLYESETFEPASNNIFDYYNLIMYSDDENTDMQIYVNVEFIGNIKLSSLEFDMLSYDDLTIMQVQKLGGTGDYTTLDDNEYLIINKGYSISIVFNESINTKAIRLKIENHNPVPTSGKRVLINDELKAKLTGRGNIENTVIEYLSNAKLSQSIDILTDYIENINSSTELEGYVYAFILGNFRGAFFGNTDIIRSTVNYDSGTNIIGHSLIYDIDSVNDYYAISNAMLNNKRYVIPDYSTLSYDDTYGIYYKIRLYAETNLSKEIKVNLIPTPLEYDAGHANPDLGKIKIYRVSDLTTEDTPEAEAVIYHENFISSTLLVSDKDDAVEGDSAGGAISSYSGEPFIIEYYSRGRYNLFKELGYPHIYLSKILNTDVDKYTLYLSSGGDVDHIAGEGSDLDEGLYRNDDNDIKYQRTIYYEIDNTAGAWDDSSNTVDLSPSAYSPYIIDTTPIVFYGTSGTTLPSAVSPNTIYYAKYASGSGPGPIKIYTDPGLSVQVTFSGGGALTGTAQMKALPSSMDYAVDNITIPDKNYICVKEEIEINSMQAYQYFGLKGVAADSDVTGLSAGTIYSFIINGDSYTIGTDFPGSTTYAELVVLINNHALIISRGYSAVFDTTDGINDIKITNTNDASFLSNVILSNAGGADLFSHLNDWYGEFGLTVNSLYHSTTYGYVPGTLFAYYGDILIESKDWSDLLDITQPKNIYEEYAENEAESKKVFMLGNGVVDISALNPNDIIDTLTTAASESDTLEIYYQPLNWPSIDDVNKIFYNIVDYYSKELTTELSGTTHSVDIHGLVYDYYIMNSGGWISDGNLYINQSHPSLEYIPMKLVDASGNNIYVSDFDISGSSVSFTTTQELSGTYRLRYYYLPVQYDIENILISNSYISFNGMLYLVDYQ